MEKIKLLLYCTKNKPYLSKIWNYNYELATDKEIVEQDALNGKIVAECDFEVEWWDTSWCCSDFIEHKGLEKSCLIKEQLFDYVKGRNEFYAIHIKNLKERVMELSKCHKNKKYESINFSPTYYMPITNAPQNMCRVWIYEDGKWVMYILISVRPEWLCLELNGIKTVEVRKRVLKGML